jgi:hypothetical protein
MASLSRLATTGVRPASIWKFKKRDSKFFRLQAPDIPQSRQKNICRNLERQISRGLQTLDIPQAPSENKLGLVQSQVFRPLRPGREFR